ncbi:MAG: hypothetical protein D6696_16735 [Acidobacteria bacterium]|nr:MAG: hypothetical protein D6696_16735 [Acidobacteriota bacterium]
MVAVEDPLAPPAALAGGAPSAAAPATGDAAGGQSGAPVAAADEPEEAGDPFATAGGEGLLRFGDLPVTLSVFGNLDLASETERGTSSGFENGALDLFFTAQISPRWSFLVELVFETEPESNEVIADLERLRAAYDHSDLLRLEFGRLHNSLVQWNVEQHHGLYLQTTATKPLMTEWEDDGGLWPVHVVGARASGTVHEAMGFHYELTVANGRGAALDDIQVGGDLNSDKAVVLSLGVAPPAVPGLRLTATGYRDEIPRSPAPLRERVWSLSARYLARGVELRSEWSRIEHRRPGNAERLTTSGYYVLFSYRLPGIERSLRPYLLVEEVDVEEDDPFFAGAEDARALSLGVRWDLRPGVAVKGEYRREEVGRSPAGDLVRVQLAFGF